MWTITNVGATKAAKGTPGIERLQPLTKTSDIARKRLRWTTERPVVVHLADDRRKEAAGSSEE